MKNIFRKLVAFLLVLVSLTASFLTPVDTAFAQSYKKIEINLSEQRLYAYNGNILVYSFPISSGNPWTPTVTGTFYPWIKLRYDEMIGGSWAQGDYYDLPNVPYVVYFYQGYALHGTYWHNNFGHPMSHGCVNLRTSDMAELYYWIDYSTPIIIYGRTPGG